MVLNVVDSTGDDSYLTSHGSTDAMKQAARRFRQSQFPDLGKQQDIKVNQRHIIVFLQYLILLIQNLVVDPLWFELRPGSQETLLLFDNGAGRENGHRTEQDRPRPQRTNSRETPHERTAARPTQDGERTRGWRERMER